MKTTKQTADYPCIGLNGQYLEIVKRFCYIGDTIEARGGGFDFVIIRISSGWCKFSDDWDSVHFFRHNKFALLRKGRLCSVCVRSAKLYGSET